MKLFSVPLFRGSGPGDCCDARLPGVRHVPREDMNSASLAVTVLATLTRRAPQFRGLGRGYRLLNGVLVSCGARPIVDARMKDGTTIRVDLRTHTELDAFYRGEYDPDLVSLVLQILDPSKHFLDVGANVGFYSVSVARFLKSSGARGRVLAFEPVDANYSRLVENLRTNELLDRAQTYQVGLSNRAGTAKITLREDFAQGGETGNAAIAINEVFDAGFATQEISLSTLDELWLHTPHPDGPIGLVKLDVEGHEHCVLEGARTVLGTHRPVILMEVNKPYFRALGVDLDSAFSPFLPADYTIFSRVRGTWTAIKSLHHCRELENVFLVPAEQLQHARLAPFRRA
jgi:FkbM family methyltransferase